MALDLFRVSGGLQIDDSTQILEGAVAPTLDAPVGSLFTLTTNGTLYTKIAAGSGADKWSAIAGTDGVLSIIAAETTLRIAADLAETSARIAADTTLQTNIDAVGARVDALGNAFNYVGVVAGGAVVGTPTNLTLLAVGAKDPGDYYKVSTAGYFTDGTTTWHSNVGDGLVWNLSGQIDFIDNTNSQVQGTASEISVTGSTDTGFVVGLDTAFSGRVTTLETGLSAEVTARAAADTAETSARIAGDAANAAAILAETTARAAADTVLQNNITAEAAIRSAADVTLQANINTEITARIAGDAANATAVAAETTARIAGDTTLQANIDAEITARTAADATLTANLATEVTARTAADAALQASINTEITARIAGDSAEAAARTAADTTLQANINAEAAARAAADTTLTTNLATLQTFVDRDGKVTTANAVQALSDTVAVPVSAVQWIVYVQDAATPTKVSAYEVFAASSGTAVDFTRFGILKIAGGVSGVAVTASINGTFGIDLSVTTTANANIKIKRVAAV